jgi:hypothetical protein
MSLKELAAAQQAQKGEAASRYSKWALDAHNLLIRDHFLSSLCLGAKPRRAAGQSEPHTVINSLPAAGAKRAQVCALRHDPLEYSKQWPEIRQDISSFFEILR